MPKHLGLLMLMFTVNSEMYGRCKGHYKERGKLTINTNLKLSKLINNGDKERRIYSE